jgi:hypothetical protein
MTSSPTAIRGTQTNSPEPPKMPGQAARRAREIQRDAAG